MNNTLNLNLVLIPGLVSAILAYFITPLTIKLVKKIGLIDDPAKKSHPKVIHTIPTPRGGGLAIFLAILISILFFLPVDKYIIAIAAGGLVLIIMGLLDDAYDLNPYLRLFIQFIAACIPIASGIGIAFLSNPFGGLIDLSEPQISFYFLGETRQVWILSDLFALFWIVILMNFLNIGAKAVPGQLSGVVAIAAFVIGILSLEFSADITQWPVTILAFITMGAYLGFLPWHTFPQKIMPSFSGSNLGGYLLGILSILSTAKVGTLFIVLAVPLIDTSYTLIRRIINKKSPVRGDRGHLHHKLMDALGWSQFQVALFYWAATLILGIVALGLNTTQKFYTIIAIAVLIGILLLWLTRRLKLSN